MRTSRLSFVIVTLAAACGGADDAPSAGPGAGSAGAVSGGSGGSGGAGVAGSKGGASAAGQSGVGGGKAGGPGVGGGAPFGGAGGAEPFGGAGGAEPFGGAGGGEPFGGASGAAGGAGAGGAVGPMLVPPPAAMWSRTFGGAGRDYVFALAPAPDGGVYVGGVTGDAMKPVVGLVARYGSDGTQLWMKSVPRLFVTSLAVDSTGQLLVGGAFDGPTDLAGIALPLPKGATDGVVAKLTPDGVGVFAVPFASQPAVDPPGDARDMVLSVSIGKDDRVFVVGSIISDLLSPVAQKGAGKTDLLVRALDKTGAPVFAELVGGVGDELALGACVQPNGQLAVAPSKGLGPFTFAGVSLGAGLDRDVAHLFFSADGAPLLAREFNAAQDQTAIHVACHPDGGLVMVGDADTVGGYQLGVVSRFDASGALLWVTPNPYPTTYPGPPSFPGGPPPPPLARECQTSQSRPTDASSSLVPTGCPTCCSRSRRPGRSCGAKRWRRTTRARTSSTTQSLL